MKCDLTTVQKMNESLIELPRLSRADHARYLSFLQSLPPCRRALVERARKMVESGELLTSQSAQETAQRMLESFASTPHMG